MSEVVNFFDYKLKKLDDEDLIRECLIHLKAIEIGLLTQEQKVRAKLLFSEAITRPALEFIRDDFKVALLVIDKIYP